MMRAIMGSIKVKIILLLFIGTIVVSTIFSVYGYSKQKEYLTQQLQESANRKISRDSQNLILPLWELDRRWIETIIDTEMMDKELYAVIITGEGGINIRKKRNKQWESTDFNGTILEGEFVKRSSAILHDNQEIGEITIYLTNKFLDKSLMDAAINSFVNTFLMVFFLIISTYIILERMILGPLNIILNVANTIARGEYSQKVKLEQYDEIGQLGRGFNSMIERISEREIAIQNSKKALELAHSELEAKVKLRTLELTRANQKLKELDQLKSMFIASMSHELRTPLNSIIGFTSVILQGMSGEISKMQRDQLTRVKKAGEHLLSLITDVIDISKIEAGRIEAEPESFMLNELLNDIKEEMDLLATQKQLKIIINSPKNIELFTDRRRLYQCILNYVSNSVKFTDRAGTIEMKVQEDGDKLEISVTDTGIGIKKEDISKLFEAFERLETHLRVKAGGSGLGLYLTKKITTELLLGSVFVQSEEGVGSTFGLVVPKKIEVKNGD